MERAVTLGSNTPFVEPNSITTLVVRKSFFLLFKFTAEFTVASLAVGNIVKMHRNILLLLVLLSTPLHSH